MGKWKWPNISKDLPRVEFPVQQSNLASIFSLAVAGIKPNGMWKGKKKHEGGATCLFALAASKKLKSVCVGIQCV